MAEKKGPEKGKNRDTYSSNPNVKRPGVKVQYTAHQMEEYVRCVRDPVYFIRNYVKIISLDKGIIPFETWPWQDELVNSFNDERFVCLLAPRQSGKTQTTSAYLLWCILFNSDYTVAILANKHTTAIEIVERVKTSYEMLPLWLQQGVTSWNRTSIELENGSRIISNATSPSAIRGFSINMLYLDEFGIVAPSIQEEFWASVYPTISSGDTTKIIVSSTPKGLNKFYKIWDEAVRKKNGFKPIQIHWSEVPGRDEKWAKDQRNKLGDVVFEQEFGCVTGDTMVTVEIRGETKVVTMEELYGLMNG